MNLSQHTDLWKKIQALPLDEPGAAITFSTKLSSQQNWSPSFTKRAIEEYRRFIFLCCISPTGASPSKTVDEVWHLHLTYTHSYWIKLCREIAGKDIHHMPSKGGDDENHKHEDWYNETLLSYKNVFAREAPADIWPLPVTAPGSSINEPHITIRKEIIVLVIALMLVPFVFILWKLKRLNPFALTGPEFLFFYPLLVITGIISLALLQGEKRKALQSATDLAFPASFNAFEAAQFMYGKHRAIQTAIVDMIQRNLLEIRGKKHFVVHGNRYSAPPVETNPLIDDLLKQKDWSAVNYEIIVSWYNENKMTGSVFNALAAFAQRKEPFIKTYLPVLIAGIIGMARIVQGTVNGYPVTYLFFMMLFAFFIMFIVNGKLSRKYMVVSHSRKIYGNRISRDSAYNNIIQSFAFSGTSVIAGFSEGILLASVFAAASSDSVSSGGSSSCSSCSGGSCGGGGCGGCGGGD
jgi:uncharacterized protein (TIGR04222 family)